MTRLIHLKTVAILVCILTFIVSVWLMNAEPVLIEWHYGIKYGSICDPPFVVLNPFRNREAENSANEFLSQLKTGNLGILDNLNLDVERLEQIKNGESNAKINSWFISNKIKENNRIRFTYWVERNYGGGCQSMPTEIEVERNENSWKVIGYGATY